MKRFISFKLVIRSLDTAGNKARRLDGVIFCCWMSHVWLFVAVEPINLRSCIYICTVTYTQHTDVRNRKNE
jgi:hypothetical protein